MCSPNILTYKILIFYNILNRKAVVEANLLQRNFHGLYVIQHCKYSPSASSPSSPLYRFRGGALAPDIGENRQKDIYRNRRSSTCWRLSFSLRSLRKDDAPDAERNSNISSSAEHHGNDLSDDSRDQDDKDDGNFSSTISDQISELLLKFNKDDAINALATKLLSDETNLAVKNIQSIIANFPDFGVVDIFAKYPTKDVVASVLALSRLQHVNSCFKKALENEDSVKSGRTICSTGYSETSIGKSGSVITTIPRRENNKEVEEELLRNLAHYATFANAAYGWKFGLLSGNFHLSNLAALTRKTGIQRHNVIATNWSAKTHLPAYFIVRDVERQKIVLSIRGTLSIKDVLTDLCCTAEDFLTHDDAETPKSSKDNDSLPSGNSESLKYRARAHHGMLTAARGVARKSRKLIASELASNPNYDLIIVGHSLGGGTAAVLGTMWQNTFPGVVVYAYGCPCVGPLNAQPTINKSIISVVGEGDPFSCLSLGHLADISSALSELCENLCLRNEILVRTRSDVRNMSDTDVKWSIDALEELQVRMKAEKFYPPGRILHMAGNLFGNRDCITLKEVNQDRFQDLRLHSRMLDLSQHIPHRYEGVLRRICFTVQENSSK